MSTILKALKRLEHEKQAEATRTATHDPLAPALSAPEPKPKTRRSLAGPLVVAAAAALIGAGLSYGVASWWFSQGQPEAASDVAAGAPSSRPLAAIPATPRETTAKRNADAAPPVGGIEPAAQASPPFVAQTRGAGGGSSAVAQAEVPDPDPWEAAARAAPSDGRSEEEVAAEGISGGSKSPNASSAASSGASSSASSDASSPRTAASSAASRPPLTPGLPSAAPQQAAAPAPPPTRRTVQAQSIEGARPVSSLPELALPEPTAAPPPPVEVAKKPAPAPVRRTEPASTATATPEPRAMPVRVEAADSRLEIFVVKTVWHPKPERRSARLRLSDRVELVEVHEEDVVEGYVVREITPSSVVLARGDVVLTHRVGR